MNTVYDWVTVALFAALVVLFLQRSTGDTETDGKDSLLLYLAAGVGLALCNYTGNQGWDWAAIPLLAITIAFILYFLKPFTSSQR